jgi:hypothetical protein
MILARDNLGRIAKTHGVTVGGVVPLEYASWRGMMERCYNPECAKYPRYGGRGITVCERWHDVRAFISDMGKRPSPEHSIGRIDNDGNYEPSNCRWETRTQQSRNRSCNKLITHNGETLPVTAWAEKTGINAQVIYKRKDRLGWDDSRAVTIPVRKLTRRK